MTRETKIGLLVGLAFIIIVGILLSEPLNHAGDAQPAPLPFAGQNVRAAVNTPGTTNTPAPPISLQTTPGGATPAQPVPTREEVTKPRGGIQIVVGGGNETAPPSNTPPSTPLSNDVPTPVTPRGHTPAAGGHTTPPPSTGGDEIFRVANEQGEPLVPAGTHPDPVDHGKPSAAKVAKQYTAGVGDSLSKIAAKFYGSSSKAFRDAIVAANPSLKGDPNKIIAGVNYAIPAAPTDAPAAPVTPPPAPTPAAQKAPAKPAGTEYFYTVKPGDNLWAIARDQCGDTAAVPALKELNKDALKGGDAVHPGMKIKLPNKPVASVN